MKLRLTLRHGSRTSEHKLELLGPVEPGNQSKVAFVLDDEVLEADCARVAAGVYSVLIEGRSYDAQVTSPSSEAAAGSGLRVVKVGLRHYEIEVHDPRQRRGAHAVTRREGPQEITAPMPGKIVKVLVERNQEVAQGTGLLVIEAMKMQNELRAPRSGLVDEIFVAEGAGVESGARLVRLVCRDLPSII